MHHLSLFLNPPFVPFTLSSAASPRLAPADISLLRVAANSTPLHFTPTRSPETVEFLILTTKTAFPLAAGSLSQSCARNLIQNVPNAIHIIILVTDSNGKFVQTRARSSPSVDASARIPPPARNAAGAPSCVSSSVVMFVRVSSTLHANLWHWGDWLPRVPRKNVSFVHTRCALSPLRDSTRDENIDNRCSPPVQASLGKALSLNRRPSWKSCRVAP